MKTRRRRQSADKEEKKRRRRQGEEEEKEKKKTMRRRKQGEGGENENATVKSFFHPLSPEVGCQLEKQIHAKYALALQTKLAPFVDVHC